MFTRSRKDAKIEPCYKETVEQGMIVVGVRQAKARMAHLIDRALAGEEVIITRRGERVARIEAVPEEERIRPQAELEANKR